MTNYYDRNKEKILARNRQWREENPDKVRKSVNQWREKNKDKLREYNRKLYRRKHGHNEDADIYQKITPEMIEEIKLRRAKGEKARFIARAMGLKYQTVLSHFKREGLQVLRIDQETAIRIAQRLANGEKGRDLAVEYGVSESYISRIRSKFDTRKQPNKGHSMTIKADLLTEAEARSLYAILVEHAGAKDEDDARDYFVRSVTRGTQEFRFKGLLGFGGKYIPKDRKVRMDSVDSTPERQSMVERTNAAIAEWYANE